MNAFVTHLSFDFRTGIRNRALLMLNYLFPLGFYLMMGFIMPGINPPFRQVLIPAMVIFTILSATLLGLPEILVAGRENGIYRSYKINGIPSLTILIIPALTTLLHLVIASALITITAPILFDAPLPSNWVNYILVMLSIIIASSAISILIGVVSPNSRVTVLLSQLIFVPSMLLGGLMLPYSMLPDAAGKVAQLLPAAHGMNAFNGLAMGKAADFSPWGSLIVLLSSGIIAFGLAMYLFSWDSRNTTRRGSPLLALLAFIPFVIGIFVF